MSLKNPSRHSENGQDEDFEASEASVRVLVYTQEDRGHDPNCLETQVYYILYTSTTNVRVLV